MRKLRAEHFGGTAHIDAPEQLAELFTIRFAGEFNEFWISAATQYPHLVLAVGPAGAAIHYFPEEDHPGWLSVGASEAEGSVEFRTNTPQEPIEISASAVVPLPLATKAVAEFMEADTAPRCLKWEEL